MDPGALFLTIPCEDAAQKDRFKDNLHFFDRFIGSS